MKLSVSNNQMNRIMKNKKQNESVSDFIRKSIDFYTNHLELEKRNGREKSKRKI